MEFYQTEETNILRRVTNWIVDIVVVLALAWFTIYSFGMQIEIAGQSMSPLLNSEDVVLVNRFTYHFAEPQRMDIVVFEREDKKANVKRIIGLPGEEIQIIKGVIYIDKLPLEATGGLELVDLAGVAENPVKLGEDEYFLLGDNRNSSEDSRFVNIGNVKKDQLIGKVWLKLLPLIEVELIKSESQ